MQIKRCKKCKDNSFKRFLFHQKSAQVIDRETTQLNRGTLMFVGNQMRLDRQGYDRLGDSDCKACRQLPILWSVCTLRRG